MFLQICQHILTGCNFVCFLKSCAKMSHYNQWPSSGLYLQILGFAHTLINGREHKVSIRNVLTVWSVRKLQLNFRICCIQSVSNCWFMQRDLVQIFGILTVLTTAAIHDIIELCLAHSAFSKLNLNEMFSMLSLFLVLTLQFFVFILGLVMIFYNVAKQSDFKNRILFRYTQMGRFLFAFGFHVQLSSSKPLK